MGDSRISLVGHQEVLSWLGLRLIYSWVTFCCALCSFSLSPLFHLQCWKVMGGGADPLKQVQQGTPGFHLHLIILTIEAGSDSTPVPDNSISSVEPVASILRELSGVISSVCGALLVLIVSLCFFHQLGASLPFFPAYQPPTSSCLPLRSPLCLFSFLPPAAVDTFL